MVNKVILLGNVGKDPEVKQFDNGSVANFTLATNESYKDKNGEKVDRTEWHNIRVGMPSLVDLVSKYVKKGDPIYIEGKIRTREYEKEGQKRYITEINVENIRLMPKAKSSETSYNDNYQNNTSANAPKPEEFTAAAQIDDDLPF